MLKTLSTLFKRTQNDRASAWLRCTCSNKNICQNACCQHKLYWFRVIFICPQRQNICLLRIIGLVTSFYTPEKILWSSLSSAIIYLSLHWSNTARNKAINLKAAMTVEEIWSDSPRPTFYAIHAVTLGWFSFTATKHLPRQLHFQVKLCKKQAFDNTLETKTQPCSKWRRLDWPLQWRHQPQPIKFSREETDFDCLRGRSTRSRGSRGKYSRIRTGNQNHFEDNLEVIKTNN